MAIAHVAADAMTKDAEIVNPKALRSAVEAENSSLVRLLLRRGADPCAKDSSGYNSLHVAASTGNPEMVRLIADRVDDKNELTEDLGLSALHMATFCSRFHYSAYLYSEGYRPIVEQRYVQAIYELLKRGADPNVFSWKGWTPLHVVARSEARLQTRSLDMAKLLVRYGAHVAVMDDFNFSPLYHALLAGNVQLAEYFVDVAGGCEEVMEHFLLEAFYKQSERLVDYLLDRGASVGLVDDAGQSYLRRALKRLKRDEHCLSVAKLMMQKGAVLAESDKVDVDRARLDKVELLLGEIEAMRATEICPGEFRTTYYDVFFKRNDDLLRILRAESVNAALTAGEYASRFEHLAERIESAYAQGCKKLRQLERLQRFLREILGSVLPVDAILVICEHVRPSDMLN